MRRTPVPISPELGYQLDMVFGAPEDPMPVVEERSRRLLGHRRGIVWEGDAQTFQFSFVSPGAEEVLGYSVDRWITEPTFWGDVVVHPEDRDEAIAFCALATGRCQDHDFVYRAVRSDGTPVLLHDIVRVIRGRKGVAERLRGIMIEIPEGEDALLS